MLLLNQLLDIHYVHGADFRDELLQLRMLYLKLCKLSFKSFSTLSMGSAFQIVAKRHGILPRLSRML
ncbi:hypothetical protein D3C79_1003090 [compost metagenome]